MWHEIAVYKYDIEIDINIFHWLLHSVFVILCLYICRLAKTVSDINDQLDEFKYESEEVLCSSSSTT